MFLIVFLGLSNFLRALWPCLEWRTVKLSLLLKPRMLIMDELRIPSELSRLLAVGVT